MSHNTFNSTPDDLVGFGALTDEMIAMIKPFVEGKHVADLGAGLGHKSRILVELGASRVDAVEYDSGDPGEISDPKIDWFRCDFDQYSDGETPEVVLLSWPSAEETPPLGLDVILDAAKVIIYIGRNYDWAVCGSRKLYRQLSFYNLLVEVRHPKNSLLIYSGDSHVGRNLTFEEWCGLFAHGRDPNQFDQPMLSADHLKHPSCAELYINQMDQKEGDNAC